MIQALLNLFRRNESGQAMILVAVLAAAMMGIVGLAVEGGRVLVTYRHMQAAADMAALVGAQEAGCSSTDSACINSVRQYGCTTSQQNGFGGGWDDVAKGCLTSGGATVAVDVPPNTCSPYSLDYGNGKTAANGCSGSSTATHYDYVEVEITQNLGTIPIFNVPVSPYVHAVARHGSASPRDFAVAVLDKGALSGALTLSGSGGSMYVVGSVISNSTASDSIKQSNTKTNATCGGQWFTASTSESSPPTSYLKSYQIGSAFFSPVGCNGTVDSTTAWNPGQEQIGDPYGGVNLPPSCGSTCGAYSTWASCVPCLKLGHYYHWTNSQGRTGGSWDDGHNGAGYPATATNGDNYEYFPGLYPGGITINAGNVYFNPGVYTLGNSSSSGTVKITGGNACVFGAPICDRFSSPTIPGALTATCGSAGMLSAGGTYVDPNVNPATWYYYCSSWGRWDTWLVNKYSSSSPGSAAAAAYADLNTAPTFTNGSTATSIPLNGVTFYGNGSGSGFAVTGNGVQSLAFPNPCPGTNTGAFSGTSVPFQASMGTGDSGQTTAYYTYPSGSLPYIDSGATSSATAPTSGTGYSGQGSLYPSADLTVDGESACRAALHSGDTTGSIPDVWPGEFQGTSTNSTTGQLLHFMVFARDKTASIDLEGSGTQIWWGILYNPGDWATSGGCGATKSGCQIFLAGGSGSTGPPMVVGQIIGDGLAIGGNATLEVFYRPCDPRTANCELGPGSTLVQ